MNGCGGVHDGLWVVHGGFEGGALWWVVGGGRCVAVWRLWKFKTISPRAGLRLSANNVSLTVCSFILHMKK